MKSIMISIKPEYVCKILNKEKLLEIRKSFPKCILNGEECLVEIYCTKDRHLACVVNNNGAELFTCCNSETAFVSGGYLANGKIVAEFTLKTITEHKKNYIDVEDNLCYNFLSEDVKKAGFVTSDMDDWQKLDGLCKFDNFVNDYGNDKPLYAWHIDDLKIYDKPKELSDFVVPATFEDNDYGLVDENNNFTYWKRVQRAPQSWCYVEGEK